MSFPRITAGLLAASTIGLGVVALQASAKSPPGLGDPKRPDLVIEALTVAPYVCKNKQSIVTVSATVRNTNTKYAADLKAIPFQQVVKIRIGGNFLHGNPQGNCPGFVTLDPGGPLQIGPGAAWTATAQRCVATGGTYAWVHADPLNLVPEFRENNNYKAVPLNIQDPCKWTQ